VTYLLTLPHINSQSSKADGPQLFMDLHQSMMYKLLPSKSSRRFYRWALPRLVLEDTKFGYPLHHCSIFCAKFIYLQFLQGEIYLVRLLHSLNEDFSARGLNYKARERREPRLWATARSQL
jgi:hypothetical protein